jgi:hypothetical protein
MDFCGLFATAYRTAVNHEATTSCVYADTSYSSGHLNTVRISSKNMKNSESIVFNKIQQNQNWEEPQKKRDDVVALIQK